MMDLMSYLGERSGMTAPASEGSTSLDPGWGGGLGDMAPGIIADVGGNGSRMFQAFQAPSFAGMQAGHGTIIIVGGLIAGLIAFHVWTRGYQK